MKNALYSLIIVLITVGCNRKKTLLKEGDINGSLIQVWKFPVKDSSRYQNLFLNPLNNENTPKLDSIKVYGQVGNEYRYLGGFKIAGSEPANAVSLEYSNDTIFYVSYTKNTNNNTYETFSFKWESDSLSVLDHNHLQVPTNQFSPVDSLALLALYNSSGGDNWINKWDLKMPISTWYGVHTIKKDSLDLFNNRTGYYMVQSLVLPFNNLIGTIPEEFFKLKYLDIAACQFVGNKLNAKIRLPDYESDYDLEITLEYEKKDSINEYEPIVLFTDGANIYARKDDGEIGEELGVIGRNEKVRTINPFIHHNEENNFKNYLEVAGFKGDFIPMYYEGDTVLIFSGFLSLIPNYVNPKNVEAIYKIEQVKEDYSSRGKIYKSYVHCFIETYEWGWDPQTGSSLYVDYGKYNFQELYLYANFRFNYVFSDYFGKNMLNENMEQQTGDDEETLYRLVELDDVKTISFSRTNPDCDGSFGLTEYNDEFLSREMALIRSSQVCN